MENITDFMMNQLQDAQASQQAFLADRTALQTLMDICEAAITVYRKKNKILIAGNGGSAADAQHFAGELVSRFFFDRPALPAIALTTDTSIITAIANDYGYNMIFERQVAAHGLAGDMFIGLSTSGNSTNVIRAIKLAKERGMITVGMTGQSGGQMNHLCDLILKVPSSITPRIQEIHEIVCHTICATIEQSLFGEA